MQSIEFPGTIALAKDQPEYNTLHVFVDQQDPQVPFTTCYQLTEEEISDIVRTGRLWYQQLTFGNLFQPMLIYTKPLITEIEGDVQPTRILNTELLKTKVFESLGQASMCWSETPGGEFNSNKAQEVGEALVNHLISFINPKMNSTDVDVLKLRIIEAVDVLNTCWEQPHAGAYNMDKATTVINDLVSQISEIFIKPII